MTSKAPDRACVASFVRTCRQPHTSQAFGDEIFFAVTECGSRLPSSTPHPKEPLSALGGIRHRVPPRPRVDVRFAALAARRIACVSAASAAMSPAWETISVHVVAADVVLPNTGSTAAVVTTGTGKLGPVVVAVSGGQAAPRLGALLLANCQERRRSVLVPIEAIRALGGIRHRVPPRLRIDVRFAALTARRKACVSAAPAAMSPARETISVHIVAADVAHPNTGSTAAMVTTGTGKLGPVVVAVSGRQAAPGLGALLLANCQERRRSVLVPIEAIRALGGICHRVPPRLRIDLRFAALAARRKACVSTAPAAMSPARE